MKKYIEPKKQNWQEILQRPVADFREITETVQNIIDAIRNNGNAAIIQYNQLFDRYDNSDFTVNEDEISSAKDAVSVELKAAIEIAVANISKFHVAQKQEPIEIETMPGVKCYRKNIAIQSVGLYIPGGTAPLFSTLLMLGIPATIAGCKEIIICTPPGNNGVISPAILYTAELLGIKKIFKVGGAQAIAAMAYGTESISKVNKIFGPGNQFVTIAKQLIASNGIAIDLPAGPSEVAIYADETCVPAFVAADLLSQAEHGMDSQVLLVATSNQLVEQVQLELEKQLQTLSRKSIAEIALKNSNAVVFENVDQAFELLNSYAPEHLILASTNARFLSGLVINAGSVFVGNYAAESLGDYASGTNHTLPTNGFAKAFSGVSLDSFVKKITFQEVSEEGLTQVGPATITMAMQEGLQGHAEAISLRLQAINTI